MDGFKDLRNGWMCIQYIIDILVLYNKSGKRLSVRGV